jgi:hypothetical protein
VKRAFRISAVAGLVVLALAIVSGVIAKPQPCGGLPASYPPMVAFELARTGADLRALFGDAPSACRTTLVQAMDTGNYVDMALFTPAYCIFLLGFFAAVRTRAPGLARLGAALAIVAAITDLVEDVCLLGLTPALDPTSPWLARLPWITAVKWLALGGAGGCGGLLLARGGRRAMLGAAVCMLAPLATIAAIAAPARFGPFVAAGVGASWVVFLVIAIRGARAAV